MADPPRESPLAGASAPGRFGVESGKEPAVTLGERRPSAVLVLNGAPDEAALGQALGGEPVAGQAFEAFGATFLWTGPRQWLATAFGSSSTKLRGEIERALQGTAATVTDLSHARTVIRVEGKNAIDVLSKGCPVDLELFPVGGCGNSLLGHHAVTLHRSGDDAFDVHVMRSFGLDAWNWLREAAAEYGGDVGSGRSGDAGATAPA